MMKKLITFLLLLLSMSVYSQSYKEIKFKISESDKFESKGQLSPYNLDLFNEYNRASIKYQYGAIGCAATATGLFIGYGCMKDKFELRDGKEKMKKNAQMLMIGGGTFAALAIVLEICSINLKTKSNHYLQLHLKGEQAALSYSF